MLTDFGPMFYFYLLIFVIGTFGNARVLHLIGQRLRRPQPGRLQKSGGQITDLYVLNLALADVCTSLTLPVVLWCMASGRWTFGGLACKAYSAFDALSKFVSVLSIVLLSFDRYLAVCHPIWSRRHRNRKQAAIMALSAWLTVGFFTTPTFIFADVLESRYEFPDPENSSLVVEIVATKCVIQLNFVGSTNENNNNNDNNDNISNQNGNNSIGQQEFSILDENSGGEDTYHIFLLCNFFLHYLIPSTLICVFYSLIAWRLKSRSRKFIKQNNQNNASNLSVNESTVAAGQKLSTELPIPTEVLKNRYLATARRISQPLTISDQTTLTTKVSQENLSSSSHHNRNSNSLTSSKINRSTLLILAIILAYTLCWLPYWLLQLVLEFAHDQLVSFFDRHYLNFKIFSLSAYALQMTNSALNPYFYLISTLNERKSLKGGQLLKLMNNHNPHHQRNLSIQSPNHNSQIRINGSVISVLSDHSHQSSTTVGVLRPNKKYTVSMVSHWSQDWPHLTVDHAVLATYESTKKGRRNFLASVKARFYRSDDVKGQAVFAGHLI
uniref:G-protein coupled receptors family 1 profile domain-containing protein n=1 Tax=Romanomermis culicivorax TaxID=13658 RepID=A0A915HI26_ROMCU